MTFDSSGNMRLFGEGDLKAIVSEHVAEPRIEAAVQELRSEHFIGRSEDDLVQHFVTQLRIEPIELDEGNVQMSFEEADADVSNDSRFMNFGNGPHTVPGVRIAFTIPFRGDAQLWRFKPHSVWTIGARGTVSRDERTLAIAFVETGTPDADAVKKRCEQMLHPIRMALGEQRSAIEYANSLIEPRVRSAVKKRVARLTAYAALPADLGVSLKTRAGMPQYVEIRPRVLLSKLDTPVELAAEPAVADETYNLILGVIRQFGRSFEATPGSIAVHDEEEIRDFFLAALNIYFEGTTSGESFRGEGKTDILLKEKSKAAFVGECKIWHGEKKLHEAIDQLLSYATWRDSKAALVIFNKNNSDFTALRTGMAASLASSRLFQRSFDSKDPGEWRIQLSSPDDQSRKILLHVFLFNFYVAPTAGAI